MQRFLFLFFISFPTRQLHTLSPHWERLKKGAGAQKKNAIWTLTLNGLLYITTQVVRFSSLREPDREMLLMNHLETYVMLDSSHVAMLTMLTASVKAEIELILLRKKKNRAAKTLLTILINQY